MKNLTKAPTCWFHNIGEIDIMRPDVKLESASADDSTQYSTCMYANPHVHLWNKINGSLAQCSA